MREDHNKSSYMMVPVLHGSGTADSVATKSVPGSGSRTPLQRVGTGTGNHLKKPAQAAIKKRERAHQGRVNDTTTPQTPLMVPIWRFAGVVPLDANHHASPVLGGKEETAVSADFFASPPKANTRLTRRH